MKLISLIPLSAIKEAEESDEKETSGSDESGESSNPFAAASKEDSGGEEGDAEAGSEDAAEKDAEGGEEGEEGTKDSGSLKPLDIAFNPSKVRRYNKAKFKGNQGTVSAVSRYGLTVTMPDSTSIFVNFSDIL